VHIDIPPFVRDLIESIAFVARGSELVDQSSGVSARLTIAAVELLQSNLERRAALTGDRAVFPRLADFSMLLPAITGKVEMVYEGEQQGSDVVARKLIGQAVAKLFESKFPAIERAGVAQRAERERRGYGEIDTDDLDDAFAPRRAQQKKKERREEAKPASESEPAYESIVGWFADGNKITVSDEQPFAEFFRELNRVPGLADVALKYARVNRDEELAFWMEMVLEGLHQSLRLSREDLDSTITWQELVKFNVLRTVR
jgi:magnesium chelatase subunit I